MTKYREILRLYSLGISQRGIAASCLCSRKTIIKVLKRAQDLNIAWPLPATPYELAQWKKATVQFNYHISVDKNHYSW
jgi:hypothetical protein